MTIFGRLLDKIFERLANELPIPIFLMLLLWLVSVLKPELLSHVSRFVLVLTWTMLALWTLGSFALRRWRQVKAQDKTGGLGVLYPEEHYEELWYEGRGGVKWKVRRTRYHSYVPFEDTPVSDLEVCIPPRCPKCKTELEQRKNFWFGFTWSCVGCDFKKRSAVSFEVAASRVERLLKRQLEQLQEKLRE